MVWPSTSVDCDSSRPFGFQVSRVTDGLFIFADGELLVYSEYMAMSLTLFPLLRIMQRGTIVERRSVGSVLLKCSRRAHMCDKYYAYLCGLMKIFLCSKGDIVTMEAIPLIVSISVPLMCSRVDPSGQSYPLQGPSESLERPECG